MRGLITSSKWYCKKPTHCTHCTYVVGPRKSPFLPLPGRFCVHCMSSISKVANYFASFELLPFLTAAHFVTIELLPSLTAAHFATIELLPSLTVILQSLIYSTPSPVRSSFCYHWATPFLEHLVGKWFTVLPPSDGSSQPVQAVKAINYSLVMRQLSQNGKCWLLNYEKWCCYAELQVFCNVIN